MEITSGIGIILNTVIAAGIIGIFSKLWNIDNRLTRLETQYEGRNGRDCEYGYSNRARTKDKI